MRIGHAKSYRGFPGDSVVKNQHTNAGARDLIPRLGKSPGEGNGNPHQYSSLGNPMARGAWWATSTWDLKELNMTEQLPRIRNSLDNGKDQTPNKQAKHNLYSIMGSYINLVYEAIK